MLPDPDWQINSWSGTDNDGSTADANTATMPAGNHTVTVNYIEIPAGQLALGTPAKPVRECKEREIEYMKKEHERTLSKAKIYKKIYQDVKS